MVVGSVFGVNQGHFRAGNFEVKGKPKGAKGTMIEEASESDCDKWRKRTQRQASFL